MRQISDLKIENDGTYFPASPPSGTEIEELESEIGAHLPHSYLALLNYKNGGHPALRIIIPEEKDVEPFLILDVLFSLSSLKSFPYSIWRSYFPIKDRLPAGMFPFGCDQGGDLFFITAGGTRSCRH